MHTNAIGAFSPYILKAILNDIKRILLVFCSEPEKDFCSNISNCIVYDVESLSSKKLDQIITRLYLSHCILFEI